MFVIVFIALFMVQTTAEAQVTIDRTTGDTAETSEDTSLDEEQSEEDRAEEAQAKAEAAEVRETVSEETARAASESARHLDDVVNAAQEVEEGAADGPESTGPGAEQAARSAAEAVADAVIDDTARDDKTGLSVEVLDPAIASSELELRLVPLTQTELGDLAAAWQEIVRAKTEDVMAAQLAIFRTEGTVADAARTHLTELVTLRKDLFDKYSKILDAWELKGGNAETIQELRLYRAAIIVEETRTADFETLVAQLLAWLTDRDGGVEVGIEIAVIVASLIGLIFLARISRSLCRKYISRVRQISKLLQAFLVGFVYWLVMAFGLMVVLSGLGIDISPIFALIGGASFILAFAFQDTLGNLASGLMIMINRPFDEGDYVDVGGVAGTARSVNIVATTVVTPDNQVIVIPNKNVWGTVIRNVTASTTRRVDLVFGISYEDSIPDAIRVMEETVKAHPLVLAEPPPMIRVNELADSSVNFVCRPWTRTEDYWTVYWDLMQQVKQAFDAAEISIPYPQQDIHVKTASPPAHLATSHASLQEPVRESEPEPSRTQKTDDPASFAEGDEGYDEQDQEGESER